MQGVLSRSLLGVYGYDASNDRLLASPDAGRNWRELGFGRRRNSSTSGGTGAGGIAVFQDEVPLEGIEARSDDGPTR